MNRARWLYRIQQVVRHLLDRPSADDDALAAALLPPPLMALFRGMSPGDQAHAARVCRALMRQGYDDPILLQAALLHDVGKAGGVPIVYRVLYVLLKRFAPRLLETLAERTAPIARWRQPLVRLAHHPAIGAEMAAHAGAHADVVALIRAHQDGRECPPHLHEHLAALQAVDDAN
ncbi:MAG: hypothetical protein D6802_05490 [Ardenticatenia bacterium]|nr:MAG: hypothetical protein D6802_05490 [Ardenticatenia bacterium]